MFSKKPQFAPQTATGPAPTGGDSRLMKIIANPYIGAGGAALLLFASLGVLIATGDPRAGAPSVFVALGPAGASDLAVSEGAADADAAPDAGDIAMASMDGPPLTESPYGGTALVTLADGKQRVLPLEGGSAQALVPAPIAGLTQPGPGGQLPIVAADGRNAAQAYARPFVSNGKPRVALIITGVGLEAARTQQALALPPDITLSIPVAQVANPQALINEARARGHEVMLEIPMEPRTYPNDDPGPETLLANARPEETWQRLDGLLARATGYFGVTNYMGEKFLTSNAAMDALATGLRRRGLAFIDDGPAGQRGGGIPRASADRLIDGQPGRDAISYQLSQLERSATQRGAALGAGYDYALTLQQVAVWAQGLAARGYQLAPASAVTTRR
jgi:polysaccharide deacetylase 2 family uncharacterized protein YibQ